MQRRLCRIDILFNDNISVSFQRAPAEDSWAEYKIEQVGSTLLGSEEFLSEYQQNLTEEELLNRIKFFKSNAPEEIDSITTHFTSSIDDVNDLDTIEDLEG